WTRTRKERSSANSARRACAPTRWKRRASSASTRPIWKPASDCSKPSPPEGEPALSALHREQERGRGGEDQQHRQRRPRHAADVCCAGASRAAAVSPHRESGEQQERDTPDHAPCAYAVEYQLFGYVILHPARNIAAGPLPQSRF